VTSHWAALGAAAGAWWSTPVPLMVLIAAFAAALRWRRAPVVTVALFLLASASGARAEAGLTPPPAQALESWVTLVDDPRPTGTGGVRATVRWQGRRLEAVAFGPPAARLDDHLAGERLLVQGRIRPHQSDWLRWRHVVARVSVEKVLDHAAAPPVFGLANWFRRRLIDGAESLAPDSRSLFTGMVIGDDRQQTPAIADDFRAAGLGHLLVVSGQNVAFVLALASPLTTRLRPGGRLVAVTVILLLFALITRFEPSVLRAVTMAGLGVGSAVLGRPENGRRVLAVAVALLIVVDPFLIHDAAFQLSVAATAGIIWLTPGLTDAIPGPRPVARALATTAGAQVAVTPLIVVLFGTVPLASLPANLLAGPAAGPVMMWGLTAGLAAGVLGSTLAAVVHWPTSVLLWWVAGVARAAALAPPLSLGLFGSTIVMAAALAVVLSRSRPVRRTALLALALLFAGVLARAPTPPPDWSAVDGAIVWTSPRATVVKLESPRSPRSLLEALRTAGVGRPDIVIASEGGRTDAHAVIALSDRFGELAIIAPPMHRVPGAVSARLGQTIVVGDAVIEVAEVEPSIEVSIRVRSAQNEPDLVR
jgi:competence protein ComEC